MKSLIAGICEGTSQGIAIENEMPSGLYNPKKLKKTPTINTKAIWTPNQSITYMKNKQIQRNAELKFNRLSIVAQQKNK